MIYGYLKKEEEYKARKAYYEIKKNPALTANYETFSPFVVHYLTRNVSKSAIAFFSISNNHYYYLLLLPLYLLYYNTIYYLLLLILIHHYCFLLLMLLLLLLFVLF